MTVVPLSVFRSTITAGGDVDPGYFGMYFGVLFLGLALGSMIVGLFIEQWNDPLHKFDVLVLGQGMGLAVVAFGGYTVAVGAFKRLDQKTVPSQPASTVTTTHTETTVPAATTDKPVPVEIVPQQTPVPTHEVPPKKKGK